MRLEDAELKHIERIVAISKAAFDSDINVCAFAPDPPPDYDSIPWHIQMKNGGHLLQAVINGEVIGAGVGTSLLIEILQLPFFDRVSDINDLILNSLGFLVGYGIYLLVKKCKKKGTA